MQQPSRPEAGFLRSLYDFSFTNYIATKIIKTLYVIITVVFSLVAVVALIGAIARGGVSIILGIIFVPIFYIIYLAMARVSLEVIAVVFRIAEYARDIRDGMQPQGAVPQGWSPVAPPQPPFGGPTAPPPAPPMPS
ncbi:MAG TPA: DUF4282 domain-containing protein [Acidimicrobiales bacterium]|nr:DUF4282 domain-containing protein [Acidimicrobiales bacterium]